MLVDLKPFLFCMNRNGIYPLMNFASQRPHPIPRALSLSQEQMETVKTPTPEPLETETRKVRRRFMLEAVLGVTNHK